MTPLRGTEGAMCPDVTVPSPRASPQPGLPAVCVFQGRDLLPDLQAAVRELQNKLPGPGLDPAQPLLGLFPTLREVHEGEEAPRAGVEGGGAVGYSKHGLALGSGAGPEVPAVLLQARVGSSASWASVSPSLKEDSGPGSFWPLIRVCRATSLVPDTKMALRSRQ